MWLRKIVSQLTNPCIDLPTKVIYVVTCIFQAAVASAVERGGLLLFSSCLGSSYYWVGVAVVKMVSNETDDHEDLIEL